MKKVLIGIIIAAVIGVGGGIIIANINNSNSSSTIYNNNSNNNSSNNNNTTNSNSSNVQATENSSNTDTSQSATTTNNKEASNNTNSNSNNSNNNDTNKESSSNILSSSKAKYLAQMKEIDEQYNKIQEEFNTPAGQSQTAMNILSYKQYKLYDDELNNIYQFIKANTPANKFEQIQKDELAWIQEKNNKLNEIASTGGTIVPINVNIADTSMTKERCLYLINTYMG